MSIVARNLSSILSSRTKSKLRSELDPDTVLRIFNSSTSGDSSRYAQAATVRRLAKSLRFGDIESLLEAHKADFRIKEESFLCTLIRSYGLVGMFDHALRTYEEMDNLGTPRSTMSFNSLLAACTESKKFEKVPELFYEMQKRFNVSPDEVSYGILVMAHCGLGEIDNAASLIRDLENKRMEVSIVSYCTLLSFLYEEGRIVEAEKLWMEMVESGVKIDVPAYNIRIMHAQYVGDVEKVKELITEIEKSGLKPDIVSYNYLMNCYLKMGKMTQAKIVFDGLFRLKCKPNGATFRTLITYLCKHGDFMSAYKVFQKSVDHNMLPGFLALEQLMRGLVAKNNIKEAKGMNRAVKERISPSYLKAWENLCKTISLPSSKLAEYDTEEEDEF